MEQKSGFLDHFFAGEMAEPIPSEKAFGRAFGFIPGGEQATEQPDKNSFSDRGQSGSCHWETVKFKVQEYNTQEKMKQRFDMMLKTDKQLLAKFKKNRDEAMTEMYDRLKTSWGVDEGQSDHLGPSDQIDVGTLWQD